MIVVSFGRLHNKCSLDLMPLRDIVGILVAITVKEVLLISTRFLMNAVVLVGSFRETYAKSFTKIILVFFEDSD